MRAYAWLGAVVVVATVGSVAAVRADDKKANVTGSWKWERPNQNGDVREYSLKLKQEGEKITGTLSVLNSQFEPAEIKEAKIKDGELTFQVTRERNGNTFITKYKGKVEGDTIKGTTETERNGETQTRDWEAKRVPADKA